MPQTLIGLGKMKALRIGLLLATFASVFWCGWILLERYQARRDWETQRERIVNPPPSEQFSRIYGGSEVKILNFYAAGGDDAPGQPRSLCYSVLNAKSVRMDPPVAGVYPTLSKCVEVRPKKETRYTLTAEDSAGHSASASLVLSVNPNPGTKRR